MRSLADTRVLARALLAAFITATACLPRLAQWPLRSGSTLFLWFTLLGVAWMLWAFVFAWHFKYSQRPVFPRELRSKLWMLATLYAVAAAVGHYLIDPRLRAVAPAEFPTDPKSWLAMTLFSLAFEPLFLCFAPFAFFIRLTRKPEVASALTVAFGIFILALRLTSSAQLPPLTLAVELLLLRLIGGYIVVSFYLRGGAVLVWWIGLLLQLRYLAELALTGRPS